MSSSPFDSQWLSSGVSLRNLNMWLRPLSLLFPVSQFQSNVEKYGQGALFPAPFGSRWLSSCVSVRNLNMWLCSPCFFVPVSQFQRCAGKCKTVALFSGPFGFPWLRSSASLTKLNIWLSSMFLMFPYVSIPTPCKEIYPCDPVLRFNWLLMA